MKLDLPRVAEAAMNDRDGLLTDIRRGVGMLARNSMMPESAVGAMVEPILDSKVVIWQHDLFDIATNGYTSFVGLDISSVRQPLAPQFWYFSGFNVGLPPEYFPPKGYTAGAMLFIPSGYKSLTSYPLLVYVLFSKARPLVLRNVAIKGEKLRGNGAQVFACLAFMELKIAAKESVLLPRPVRRQAIRANRVLPEISVIQLRERERSESGIAGGYHLRNRHIRSWCWRRLTEPLKHDSKISGGRAGDEVVFIRSTVVGPAGAPLLSPRKPVFSVSR